MGDIFKAGGPVPIITSLIGTRAGSSCEKNGEVISSTTFQGQGTISD